MNILKDTALMVLANGVYAEAITEDQAINIMTAMDASSSGTAKELEDRAKALSPILTDLAVRYAKETTR